MKRLSTAILTLAIVAGMGLSAVAGPTSSVTQGNIGIYASTSTTGTGGAVQIAQAGGMPPMEFGAPPSGEVPILFNDHHVYTKPDRLKQGRVLAALVRGTTILVPLRSMFEQMGATVSYDPATKTADVSKPGSDVKVTVGKPEVVINGETRPLDVPPEIYKGVIVVPVRVISEGMGAYVQWVPDKHVVVVRYVSAPPPPPAPPAPPPTMAPTAAPPPPTAPPTPAPAATSAYEHFIAGDYLISPKVYNEYSPGNSGKNGSYAVRGAIEFPAFGLPWMIEGDYRQYSYPHNSNFTAPFFGACPNSGDQGCVTIIGYQNYLGFSSGQGYAPAFTAREQEGDARLGLKIADPRIYIGVGYYGHNYNYSGYPNINGFGFGIEKLPDLDQSFSLYGSAWYYPQVKGTYSAPAFSCVGFPAACSAAGSPSAGASYSLQYRVLKYQIGGTVGLGSNFFLDLGFLGDRMTGKSNAPSDAAHSGPYIGLGIHF